jgi:hypothetical protein
LTGLKETAVFDFRFLKIKNFKTNLSCYFIEPFFRPRRDSKEFYPERLRKIERQNTYSLLSNYWLSKRTSPKFLELYQITIFSMSFQKRIYKNCIKQYFFLFTTIYSKTKDTWKIFTVVLYRNITIRI